MTSPPVIMPFFLPAFDPITLKIMPAIPQPMLIIFTSGNQKIISEIIPKIMEPISGPSG